jgi:PAS domain S-box-containing protein
MLADKWKSRESISVRLILGIVGFSTFIAIFTSAVQLFLDYRRDVDRVHSDLAYVEVVSLRPLSTNLWNLEEENVQQQLDGLANHPGIDYAAIKLEGEIAWDSGTEPKGNVITAEYPLVYERRNVRQELGRLHIVAGLSAIYQQLVEKALVILGTNFLKTLAVAAFMYVFFHIFFTRHLVALAGYARNMNLKDLAKPLRFQRTATEGERRDEFDDIADAMNQMRENLKKSYDELVEHKDRLEERTRELQESEALFRAVVDHSPTKIHIKDMEGRYTLINKEAEKLFGVTDEEGRGKTTYDLFEKDVAEAYIRHDQAVIESGEAMEGEELFTLEDGVHTFLTIKFPIRDQEEITGIGAIGTDITERKEAQAQLIQASKLATLGEMASGIAHEINQPLSVVGMAAENSLISMEEGTFDTEFVRRKLETIVGQKERMAGIINHMRLFSRRDTTAMEPFNPVESVRGAVGLIAKQFQASGVELEEDLPAACRDVFGHPVQLEQVVLNLLNNARDAVVGAIESAGSGQGRPAPMVRISLVDDKRGKTVVISVADNGGGIPIQTLGRIFDPFFTTKKEGHGTGLGLSISYSIIDAMGGSLQAQNADGGVEFRISVPAAVDGSGAVDRRSRKKERKAGTRKRRSGLPRVLVVDDEEGIAEELAEYLQVKGYDVATAGSGLEALELHRSRPADVVITDLFMPEMDGNELIRRLRRTDPDLPIMLVTGHTTFGDEKESVTEGASAVLKKPVSLRELSDTLSNMVRYQRCGITLPRAKTETLADGSRSKTPMVGLGS